MTLRLRSIKQRVKQAIYAMYGFRTDIKVAMQTVNPGDQAWYFAAGSLQFSDTSRSVL